MTITRIGSGPRMSQAVIHGDTVWLAGQVGTEGADITTQARAALASVDALLAEAGTDKRALVSIQIVLADIKDAPAMNRAWDAWLDPAHKPARMTIQAPLVDPAWKVEITGVALAPA